MFTDNSGNNVLLPRKKPSNANTTGTNVANEIASGAGVQPPASAAGDCETGGSNPSTEGAATGEQAGADPNAPNMKEVATRTRQGELQPSFKKNMSEIGAKNNVTFEGFSNGNTASGATGSSRHGAHLAHHNRARVSGYATDARIRDNATGRYLNPARPGADRDKVCNILKDAGSRGINGIGYDSSGYMGQLSMHFDAWGTGNSPYRGSPAVWGDNGSGSRAQPWVQSCIRGGPPTGGADTSGDNPAGNNAAAGCNQNGSGCQPISSAAPGAAASMVAGQGMAPAAGLLNQITQVAQNPMALAGAAVQQFAAAAGPIGQVAAMAAGGLSDPTSLITKGVQGAIEKIGGAGPLSALTGVIPTAFSSSGLQGMLTQNLQNIAGSIIKQGIPQLGNFANVFNSALGAAGSATNIATAINGAVNQVFGKAIGGISSGQFPGINLTDFDPLEGIEGADSVITNILKPKIDSTINFVGPIQNVLEKAVNAKEFDAFSSYYMDYNSMVTHGFGNLTDNLIGLGKDLQRLGKIGDLTDLLNIGTPRQLVRQFNENGLGISTGLSSRLVEEGLTGNFYTNDSVDDQLFNILKEINNAETIDYVKEVMEIDKNVNISNLGELLDSKIIFAESYNFNRFQNLRDMALTLATCAGIGNISNFSELGGLLRQMETAEGFEELNEEYQPLRIEEADSLSNTMLIESYFGNRGPVLADFIGTAAGYVHADTLPAIATLLNEITGIDELADFDELMVLLTETLQGNYRVVDMFTGIATIVVPSTSEYSFGTYTTLDDAVTAIKNAIEEDLEYIYNDAKDNDPELFQKLINLESFHNSSAQYLYHEQRMRQTYGIDIGDSRGNDNYVGDGTTTAFPLSGLNPKNIVVYQSGVYQSSSNWTYNSTTKTLNFTTAPVIGTLINISYDTDSSLPEGTPADVWQLASSLETYALETGFGGPADFLNRVATNDRHGQRIRAIMIQARNQERLRNAGLACAGYGTITDFNDENTFINFVEQTGIWASNPGRAAEIWVQNNAEVDTIEIYNLKKYKQNIQLIQNDIDILSQNLIRQLLFYSNGNLAISDLMSELYQSNPGNQIYNKQTSDLLIGYSEELPTEGYILGPYKEIIFAILDKENISNDVFTTKLSINTEDYLKSINLDIKLLVTMLQRILTANGAIYLGIDEGDFQAIFGIQSVSKAILSNIANNY